MKRKNLAWAMNNGMHMNLASDQVHEHSTSYPEVAILSFLLFRKNCHLCLRCLACSKKLLFNMMKLMLCSHNWSSILNLEVNTCLQNNCS